MRQQLKDSAEAAERLTESTAAHSKAVEAAKAEAERVVEEAKSDAERITEQLRGPGRESRPSASRCRAPSQVELLRAQLSRQLRLELGHESVRQAEELVRDYVADAAQQSATVDRFLDELDAMAPAAADVKYPVAGEDALGQSAGAEEPVTDRFDTIAKDLDNHGTGKARR